MGNQQSKDSYWTNLRRKIFSKPNPFAEFQQGTKILFIGNPGVGKSTLLNSLVQSLAFKNGASIGVGLTQILQQKKVGNVVYVDTPGLSDLQKREQAAKEIQKALTMTGLYYVFFVLTLESGRCRSDDNTTMKLVLDSVRNVPNFKFGIIVNKMSSPIKNKLMTNLPSFKEMVTLLNTGLPITTEKILFLDFNIEAHDNDNFLLPPLPDLEGFISSCSPTRIDPEQVSQLQFDMFEKWKKEIEEETRKLREENTRLLAEIVRIEVENTKKLNELQKIIEILKEKMQMNEKGARPYTPVTLDVRNPLRLIMSSPTYKKPDDNIFECVKRAIPERWDTQPWERLVKAIYQKQSVIVENPDLEKYDLTIDEALALTFYSSDVRCFGGDVSHSLFSLLNSDLNNPLRSGNNLKKWEGFFYYITQAFRKLPKFEGTVYRGLNQSLHNEDSYDIGFKVSYLNFSSASYDIHVVKEYLTADVGRVFVMRGTSTGIPIQKFSLYPNEAEVLFYPGTVLKVIGLDVPDVRKGLELHNSCKVFEFVEDTGSEPLYLMESWKIQVSKSEEDNSSSSTE